MRNMKDENIRKLWEEFYTSNIDLFETNEDIWLGNFNKLKELIENKNG